MSREVQTKFENVEQLEGAGVKIRRSIGTRNVLRKKGFLIEFLKILLMACILVRGQILFYFRV
jgi:hypothetical protein